MTSIRERAAGAMVGLAVGDALGAPAENLTPQQIQDRWGRIEDFVADTPAGTDDTDFAVFSGLLVAEFGAELQVSDVERAWRAALCEGPPIPLSGAGFSELGTVENLRHGLHAPQSAQHRHSWSDGLAMRAAPYGVFAAGRPQEAARLVAIDGAVSHEGEGILGGQAVAAAVAVAMSGAAVEDAVAAAVDVIPADSWTARLIGAATAAPDPDGVRAAAIVATYPWTDLAPEAVALALGAITLCNGDFRSSVITAVNMGRDADTTAAIAGAITGALSGPAGIPDSWRRQIGVAGGRCLRQVAGRSLSEVADLLVAGRS